MGELSAGGYRATGRPFYNHLIGVASLTAMESRDIKLISAAMLHSVYELGRFPGWLLPPGRNRRRRILTARAGADIEEIVYAFHAVNWRQMLYLKDLSGLSDKEKSLLLLKLADILEDLLEEKGPVGTRKIALWPLHKMDNPLDHLIRLSNEIGAEKFASIFASVGNQKPVKIIEKSAERTYFYTPLNSVLPYALKAQLKQLFRR